MQDNEKESRADGYKNLMNSMVLKMMCQSSIVLRVMIL